MRPKSIVMLVLALGCGLVASIGITQVMAKRSGTGSAIAGPVEKVFVALNDIPMGEPITAQMVKLEEWPKDKVQGALTKFEDLEGRRPKIKFFAGDLILEKKLLVKGASDQGATGLIPKGYRVVPVKVDQVSGGASMIRPGDRVDVLVHVVKDDSKGIPETSTRTVLQDIKVFAVDDVFVLEANEKNESKVTTKTISLLVKPDQAEMVTMASELGKIRLVMRSPEDNDQPTVSGANPQQLFGGSSGADRSREDLMKEEKAPNANADFLKFLAEQKRRASQKLAPEPEPALAPPTEKESWKVRLLSGKEVNEVVLQAEQAAANDGSDSGEIRWTQLTPGPGGATPAATPAKPSQPAAEPTETPQETPVSVGTPSATPADGAPADGAPTINAPPSGPSSQKDSKNKD